MASRDHHFVEGFSHNGHTKTVSALKVPAIVDSAEPGKYQGPGFGF